MTEEEKKAIEYYNKHPEMSFSLGDDFDAKEFLKALGIEETEEDSFENNQIRFNILINLIKKQQEQLEKKDKIIEAMIKMIDEYSEYYARYGNTAPFCDEGCIDVENIDCRDCIRQYFENKVEEE